MENAKKGSAGVIVIILIVVAVLGGFFVKQYVLPAAGTNSASQPPVPASALKSSDSPIARDTTHVWFNGTVIDGADPATFVLLPQSSSGKVYARDRYHVYVEQGSTIVEVAGADPKTFVPN